MAVIRIYTEIITHVVHCHKVWRSTSYFDTSFPERHAAYTLAWRLFILAPHMLLFKTSRGGECGKRNLQQRVRLYELGEWD